MRTVKINVPESHADITLAQYQKFAELKERDLPPREFNKRKLMIFTGLSYKEIEQVELKDYAELLGWIDKASQTDADFQPTFTLNKMEFGLIPNFDEMQSKEFFDLTMYDDQTDANLHKLMAVLYRPVTNKDAFGNYRIEAYNGTEKYAELMKQLPMSIVFGAMFFFLNLRTDLSHYILQSLEVENLKEAERSRSSKNGDGLRAFTKWLKGKFGVTRTSKK